MSVPESIWKILDLHYSDFWADPGKQITPKAWQGMTEDELEEAVYNFTVDVMKRLHAEGVAPTMVQVGNELTNGLLWPTGKKPNFDQIAKYISAGIRGVKAVDSKVPIMIHLDNGGLNEMYVEWFDNYIKRGEDFDIIGFSYYPFWHGTLEELEYSISNDAAGTVRFYAGYYVTNCFCAGRAGLLLLGVCMDSGAELWLGIRGSSRIYGRKRTRR